MNVWLRNLQVRPTLPVQALRRAAEVVFAATATPPASVGLAWVDDTRMIEEHAYYLRMHRTTDVLSFPDGGDTGDEPYCGDIMICTDQARRQAISMAHPYEHELLILFVHGLLHLLGFDHTADGGEMRRHEEALRPRCMAAGGLP